MAAKDEAMAVDEADDSAEATVLVSEFPPPPPYYELAADLEPPEIPSEALALGTRRAAAAAAKARAESERLRLGDDADKTDAILGGVGMDTEEEDGEVVAVFGEIVEDPLLIEPLDQCEDPTIVRDEVKRLNKEIVQGFVNLVQALVSRPGDNKSKRDELSHNIFLMLQECNKFREHQARELLIEVMEKHLEERLALIEKLNESIAQAELILSKSTE